jgi:hypothetical protein
VLKAGWHAGDGRAPLPLGQRTGTACVVPGLWPEPRAFAVIRTRLTIRAPGRGRLGLPAALAVALVGPGSGLGSPVVTLPRRFSGPLAGLLRTEPWGLGTGRRHKATAAMDTTPLAGPGCLLREAVFSHRGFARKPKHHTPSSGGRQYTLRNETRGEAKRRGQFWERCPWLTFSPVILARVLTGENKPHRPIHRAILIRPKHHKP